MRVVLLVPYYIRWHYSTALRSLAQIISNLTWFTWHFFSIGLLARTFFAPWQRLHEEKRQGFNIEAFLSTLAINIVMRLVGIVIRAVFIVIGLIAVAGTLILGISFFVIWLILPLLCIFLFIFGISFLIKHK